VYVTRDGGWTWRDTRQQEAQLSTIGRRYGWLLPRCDVECNALWRTRDGGLSWAPLANAANTGASRVGRAGAALVLQTDVAQFSSDDGQGWRLFFQPVTRWSETLPIDAHGHGLGLPQPAYDARCMLEVATALSVSSDSGDTWTRRQPPFSVESIAADAGVVAAVGVRRDCTQVFAVSRDLGATWDVRRLPRRGCLVSLSGDAVWLGCGRVLLTSSDGGRIWRRYDGAEAIESIAATATGAWAVSGTRGSRLWRTTDAGRTWVEQWPRLPTP
jgi:photosystem II stability/assembly factor-like uncharacterized protein